MKKIIMSVFFIMSTFFIGTKLSYDLSAKMTNELYDIEVVVLYGENEQSSSNLVGQTYGTKINVDLSSFSETFVYYIVDGKVINHESHTFRVKSDLYIIAVLKNPGELVSVFLDSNGQLIDVDYLTSGETPNTPDVSSYSKPGYEVNPTHTWSPSIKAMNYDTTFVLQYQLESLTAYDINTINATSSDDQPAFNDIVTVVSNDMDSNGYWMEDDIKIAYGNTLKFSALSNRNLSFVTSDETQEALVSFIDVTGIRQSYASYLGQVYVPEGSEIIEFGFLFNENETHEMLDVDLAELVQPNRSMASTNEYLKSVPVNTYESIRAYAVIDDGTTLKTIYSEKQIGYVEQVYASDLFISEYIEGSGQNKALEIFNGTGQAIDLSNYAIAQYNNGSSSLSSSVQLSGILSSGDVYVLSTKEANALILEVADLASGYPSPIYFNGDDSIALLKHNQIIDVIGKIGEDPGTNWVVGIGATSEFTLVRNISVNGPSMSFDENQWDVYAQDTFTFIGAHDFNGSTVVELTDEEKADAALASLELPSTLTLDANYQLPISSLYGASIDWMSSDDFVISESGQIFRPLYGEGDAQAILTYTLTLNNEERTGTISVTVLELPEEDEESPTEAVEVSLNYGDNEYSGGSEDASSYTTFVDENGHQIEATSIQSTKAYWEDGNNALRLGSSSYDGEITYTFDTSVEISSVIVEAKQYDANASLSLGNTLYSVSSILDTYTYSLDNDYTFTLSSIKRVSIMSVTIVIGEGSPADVEGSPVMSISPSQTEVYVAVGDEWSLPSVTSIDEEDGDISSFVVFDDGNYDLDTLGTYTLTWSSTDADDHETILTLILHVFSNEGGSFDGYYASLDGLSSESLESALYTLLNDTGGAATTSYDAARDHLEIADAIVGDSSHLNLIYSYTRENGSLANASWDSAATWNREHVWAKSLFNSQSGNITSDLHNLRASDTHINSIRSNKLFSSMTTMSGYGDDGSGRWYPGNDYRGDVARIIFYMDIRWGNQTSLSNIGTLSTFITWAELDPVDAFEIQRNEVIYTYQHNRNPFIDHPELVEMIYN